MIKPDAKNRSRRLQKKLRVGEFAQLGFRIKILLEPGLPDGEKEKALDDFLEMLESNRLCFGGGGNFLEDRIRGFVACDERGSVTEEHRSFIIGWCRKRPEIASVEAEALRAGTHRAKL